MQPWLCNARRVVAVVMAAGGMLELAGAASGGGDPMQPLAHLTGRAAATAPLPFTTIKNVGDLDRALQAASAAGRPVMLDFYADWCVSCKEMERFTFSDATVRNMLNSATLLKADVTRNDADDRALLQRFNLFGPPGTIFFDTQGREIAGLRVIGYQDSERFLQTLRGAGL
jgi:thiol:disulfide interchange protein DsbD